MSSIKKFRNYLKLTDYHKILKDNKVIFICLYENKLDKGFLLKKKDLQLKGFNVKFVENKKIKRFSFFNKVSPLFRSRVFIIYKSDFENTDSESIRYILKNFSITSLIYLKKFYSVKNLGMLSKKKLKLDLINLTLKTKTALTLGFFGPLLLNLKNYLDKRGQQPITK